MIAHETDQQPGAAEFSEIHPQAEEPRKLGATSPSATRSRTSPAAPGLRQRGQSRRSKYVFNIGGNKFRLIVTMAYKIQMVWVKHVLTHAEYI